jgi:hypothetical protein
MSPAPVASTAQVQGKGVRWLAAQMARNFRIAAPREMHLPNPRGETGRRDMHGRRGGRVVEGARLESVFTGDRNAGSNPALSASSSTKSIT